MPDIAAVGPFSITTCQWNSLSERTRLEMLSLLRLDVRRAAEFCTLYFDRFDILHKVGHLLIDLFRGDAPRAGATEEYCANLFALKYLQYKNETEYLARLLEQINALLEIYGAAFDFDPRTYDPVFERYTRDVRTYGALHFLSLKKCTREVRDITTVIRCLTNGGITAPDSGIIPRRNLAGQALLDECLAFVFSLSGFMPEVELRYLTDFDIRSLGNLEDEQTGSIVNSQQEI